MQLVKGMQYLTRLVLSHGIFFVMLSTTLLVNCGGGGGGGGTTPDTTPPVVTATTPPNSATKVLLNSVVDATFSEAINLATINTTTFGLKDAANNPVSGTVAYSGTTATFTPSSALTSSMTYTATIGTGVKDLAGNAMSSNYSWSFTTADTLPPTVISTVPASDALGASVNAPIEITFSELMDPASINVTNLTVLAGSTAVPGTITYSGTTASHFVFTPSATLEFNTTYTVAITTGAKDLAGNSMLANYTWSFGTESAPDTTPPNVISTIPINGATDIAVNSSLTAFFSETMSTSTINTATFTLKDNADNPVSGTVAYSGTTATFTPSSALASSMTYNTTIGTGVKDLAGNAMSSNYSWSFTTGVAPDTTPPTVTSTSPLDGATDVPLSSVVSVNFSESIDPLTINGSTFYVRYGTNGAFFTGNVSYAGVTATFTPVGLPYDASLTGLITTGVTDTSSNAMASNYTWSFRTALSPQGALDASFGTAGKVTTDISGLSDLNGNGDRANALIVQPDGKIVAAGTSYAGTSNLDDVSLARYNSDGTLDATFGNGGKIMTDFGGDDYLSRHGLIIQPDNKLIVAGTSYIGCCGDFVLARYDASGSLDTNFGTGGKVRTDFNGGNDSISGVGIQSGGKIVVAGGSNVGRLVRYNADGTLDTSFGTGGQVTDAAGFGMIMILSDDRILVINGGAVARYSADGVLDTTFGTAGKTTLINIYFIYDMTIQPDGKIVVAGGDFNPYKFAVVRYNADGTLDGNFGSNGKVTTDFGGLSGSSASAVKVQSDGKIIAAGGIYYLNSHDKPADFALARYNSDGTLDTSFGSGGLATTDFNNGLDEASALCIQTDGKLVAAGHSNANFALLRYLVQ